MNKFYEWFPHFNQIKSGNASEIILTLTGLSFFANNFNSWNIICTRPRQWDLNLLLEIIRTSYVFCTPKPKYQDAYLVELFSLLSICQEEQNDIILIQLDSFPTPKCLIKREHFCHHQNRTFLVSVFNKRRNNYKFDSVWKKDEALTAKKKHSFPKSKFALQVHFFHFFLT